MEIKKFLYLLVSLSFFALASCESMNLKTREDLESQPDIHDEQPDIHDEQPDAPEVEKPEFMQKEAPKLGVILGGGGALSFAHIGLLQELETQKVPIHAIAGLEWGALVAGAYAKNNRAHAIEWKLLKIPHSSFTQTNKSFFSSGKKRGKVEDFKNYLADVFENHKFSDLELPFACPYVNVTREKSGVHRRGYLRNAMKACWPYPPHLSARVLGANPLGVVTAANFLRQQGAEVILFVDVMSQNKLFSKKSREADPESAMLWAQNKTNLNLLRKPLIDDVIRISLPGNNINSYKSLRSIVRMGQVKSQSQVKGFAKKYAY